MKVQPGIALQGGKYLLDRALGQGGVGATYVATQTLLKQSIVIKTLDPSWQITQSFSQLRACFIEDMRLLARSQHANIVRVFDFFQEEALPFLVMEYVPGQTLYDRITTEGCFSEVEAIHYIRQVGSALSVAHRHGLIHRNISPKSIVRRQGTHLAILVGFGLGHEVAAAHTTPQNPFAPPTSNWCQGNRFAIDLYSLSATFYYLLTGHVPDGNLSLEQKPWLSSTKQAILRGLTQDPQWQLQTIDDWLKLLPNTSLPLMSPHKQETEQKQNVDLHEPQTSPTNLIPSNGATANGGAKPKSPTLPGISRTPANGTLPTKLPSSPTGTAPTQAATPVSNPRKPVAISSAARAGRHLPKFLLLTIAAATAMGAGFGLALRISATKAPGTSILHPAQGFEDKEWKGSLNIKDASSDVPIETKPGAFRNQITNQRPSKPSNPALVPIPNVPPQTSGLGASDWDRTIMPNPITPRSSKPQSVEPATSEATAPAAEPLPPQQPPEKTAPSTNAPSAPAPATAPAPASKGSSNQEVPPTVTNR